MYFPCLKSLKLCLQYSFFYKTQADNYRLRITTYSGSAGDSLSYSNGYQFSTPDEDNDGSSSYHCASIHESSWWHKSCLQSGLNGYNYANGESVECRKGIFWESIGGCTMSLKSVTMSIRPNNVVENIDTTTYATNVWG